jgi:hypothetical protein
MDEIPYEEPRFLGFTQPLQPGGAPTPSRASRLPGARSHVATTRRRRLKGLERVKPQQKHGDVTRVFPWENGGFTWRKMRISWDFEMI